LQRLCDAMFAADDGGRVKRVHPFSAAS